MYLLTASFVHDYIGPWSRNGELHKMQNLKHLYTLVEKRNNNLKIFFLNRGQ